MGTVTRRGRSRLTTATTRADGRTVPWLAADGPLAYTPEDPPERDYFFQYSWVIPGILAEDVSRREHFYFGVWHRSDAREIFEFWADAREGRTERVACCTGSRGRGKTTAPMAVYRLHGSHRGNDLMLIQHGSYQIVEEANQPGIAQGDVLLYRGIHDASTLRSPVDHAFLDPRRKDIWHRYLDLQAYVLEDSVRSFNSIHDRTKRCETSHIRDGSWLTDDLARDRGLDIDRDTWLRDLWRDVHQSYSLVRWVAKNKFGPNYVVCKTPLDNVRMTTFFAGEREVRIIDPRKVELIEAHGCRAK